VPKDNETPRKCDHHEELKGNLSKSSDLLSSILTWQAKFETQIETMTKLIDAQQQTQKEIKKCISDLNLKLAEHYTTKQQFDTFKDQVYKAIAELDGETEKKITKLHLRIDDILREYQRSTWRMLKIVIPVMALMFSIFSWVINVIIFN